MKSKITQLHALGLLPTQVMQQYTKEARELTLANGNVTNDTFLLPYDIRNICWKCVEELVWEKQPSDAISVCMWTLENPNHIFFYQEHLLMDLNYITQSGVPFTIVIQAEWHLEMIERFGHNNAL